MYMSSKSDPLDKGYLQEVWGVSAGPVGCEAGSPSLPSLDPQATSIKLKKLV